MEPDKTEKIVLYVNVRDEKNLKEWVAHHLLIGFDEIYICDHKSIVHLKGQFDNFNKNGNRVFVNRCEMDGPIKDFLITCAAKHAKQINADWMLYLDADEFFVFNTDSISNVKDLMKKYKDYDLVAFSWLMFGSNGHEKEPEGFIIDNYTKSELILCNHIKSFLRPNKFLKANAHKCDVIDPSKAIHANSCLLNPKSVLFDNPINYYDSFAYIAHYYVQSKETYLRRKLTLPRDDDGTSKENANRQEFYSLEYLNEIENYTIKNKYSEQIKKYLESIGEMQK
jgi:hypothetical protein